AVQPDLVPSIIVYASLYASLPTTLLTAVLAGLSMDALSAGPLGLSVLPLAAVGMFLHWRRELLLRESVWAQAFLGGAAALVVPMLHVALLLILWPLFAPGAPEFPHFPERRQGTAALPPVGPRVIWDLLVMAVCGALATPLVFRYFRWVEATFHYQRIAPPVRRLDREMKRGRW